MKSYLIRGDDPTLAVAESFLVTFIAGDRAGLLRHASPRLRWFGRTVLLQDGGAMPAGAWSTAEIGALRQVPELLARALAPASTDGPVEADDVLILADLVIGEATITLALIVAEGRVTKVIDPSAIKAELERLGRISPRGA